MDALSAMTPAQRHRTVSAGFAEHVAAVQDWDAASPVEGWAARDVVAHLVEWFPGFLAGGGIVLPAAPPVEDGPAAAWAAHSAAVQSLLDGPEADSRFTHPMAGEHQLAQAIDQFYTTDAYLHTWDLASAAGRDPGLDPAYAEHVLAGMAGIEDMLRASGQYGPAMPVSDDADPVTRLAAFIGRDPNWRPPGAG